MNIEPCEVKSRFKFPRANCTLFFQVKTFDLHNINYIVIQEQITAFMPVYAGKLKKDQTKHGYRTIFCH